MNQQQFDKALQSFAKAFELNPGWQEAKEKYEQVKQTIAVKEKLEAAIVQLESQLQNDPQNTDVLDKLGGSNLVLGRAPKAVEYWQKSLAIRPTIRRSSTTWPLSLPRKAHSRTTWTRHWTMPKRPMN